MPWAEVPWGWKGVQNRLDFGFPIELVYVWYYFASVNPSRTPIPGPRRDDQSCTMTRSLEGDPEELSPYRIKVTLEKRGVGTLPEEVPGSRGESLLVILSTCG